jgi:hypothetical protein
MCCGRVSTIEILIVILEEACLKKGYFFHVISPLFWEVNFPVNYLVEGGDQPFFYKVFFPPKYFRTCANMLVLVFYGVDHLPRQRNKFPVIRFCLKTRKKLFLAFLRGSLVATWHFIVASFAYFCLFLPIFAFFAYFWHIFAYFCLFLPIFANICLLDAFCQFVVILY